MSNRKVAVIGCNRSGTGYASKLLSCLGLNVGHEQMGKDGISSWLFATMKATNVPWGPIPVKYSFDTILHQVRHPLHIIESMLAGTSRSIHVFKYQSKWIELHPEYHPSNRTLHAMQVWYGWNVLCEKYADFTYQVENIEGVFEYICETLNVEPNYECLISISKQYNSRRPQYYDKEERIYIDLTFDDLASVNRKLCSKIIQLAERYNYEEWDYGRC